MRLRLANRDQHLLLWALALASVASVGLAAMPVVERFTKADQVWQAVTGASLPADPERQRVSLQPVLDLAPFGASAAAPTAPDPSLGEDSGSYTLSGVVVGADPTGSMAMIGVDGAAAASFRIGDAVAGDTVVQSIAPDHVMLATNGTTQRLTFPETAAPTGDDPEPAAKPDSFLRTLIPTAAAPAEPAGLDGIRAALIRNPRDTLQRYGIAEHANGYVITDAAPPDLLLTGLSPGDIVTALNGEALAGIIADGALFDRVAASGTAQITVMRDGATLNLTVQLP